MWNAPPSGWEFVTKDNYIAMAKKIPSITPGMYSYVCICVCVHDITHVLSKSVNKYDNHSLCLVSIIMIL